MEKFRTELTLCRQAYLNMVDVSVKMMIQMAYPGIQQDAPVIDLPCFYIVGSFQSGFSCIVVCYVHILFP
jgi:hypothetical protein